MYVDVDNRRVKGGGSARRGEKKRKKKCHRRGKILVHKLFFKEERKKFISLPARRWKLTRRYPVHVPSLPPPGERPPYCGNCEAARAFLGLVAVVELFCTPSPPVSC